MTQHSARRPASRQTALQGRRRGQVEATSVMMKTKTGKSQQEDMSRVYFAVGCEQRAKYAALEHLHSLMDNCPPQAAPLEYRMEIKDLKMDQMRSL